MNEISDSKEFIESGLRSFFENAPLSFIDVGARDGIHNIIGSIANLCHVTAYEPDQDSFSKMCSEEELGGGVFAKLSLKKTGLAGQRGSKMLHLLSAPTNHSLLEPNEILTNRYAMDKWRLLGQTIISTSTLDWDALESKYAHFGEIIKLDTQGSEYEILKGGTDVLTRNTVAIFCEVSFCQLYKGQKLFSEIEMLLRDLGFSFYGFTPIHTRSKKRLDKQNHWLAERQIFADAVFLNDPFDSDDRLDSFTDRKVKSLFVASLIFGYYDLSLELLASDLLCFNGDQRSVLERLILRHSFVNSDAARSKVNQLADDVAADPTRTVLYVGKFVDSKRYWPDFDDVHIT
jgi:FkbM family methyltransferase